MATWAWAGASACMTAATAIRLLIARNERFNGNIFCFLPKWPDRQDRLSVQSVPSQMRATDGFWDRQDCERGAGGQGRDQRGTPSCRPAAQGGAASIVLRTMTGTA